MICISSDMFYRIIKTVAIAKLAMGSFPDADELLQELLHIELSEKPAPYKLKLPFGMHKQFKAIFLQEWIDKLPTLYTEPPSFLYLSANDAQAQFKEAELNNEILGIRRTWESGWNRAVSTIYRKQLSAPTRRSDNK